MLGTGVTHVVAEIPMHCAIHCAKIDPLTKLFGSFAEFRQQSHARWAPLKTRRWEVWAKGKVTFKQTSAEKLPWNKHLLKYNIMGSTLSCTHCGIHSVILSLAYCHTNLLNITFQISETFTDFSSEILLEKKPVSSLPCYAVLTLTSNWHLSTALSVSMPVLTLYPHLPEFLTWRIVMKISTSLCNTKIWPWRTMPVWPAATVQLRHTYNVSFKNTQHCHISIAAPACYPPGQRSRQTMGHDSAPHGQGSRKGQERWEVWRHCPAQRLLCHALSGDLPIKQKFATSSYSLKTATDNEERRARKINMTKSLFICVHSEHIPSASRLGKCHHTSLKKYKPHRKRTILFLHAILFPNNSKAKRAHHRRPLLPHSVWRSWRWETCARAMPCTDQAALGNSLCQPEYRANKIKHTRFNHEHVTQCAKCLVQLPLMCNKWTLSYIKTTWKEITQPIILWMQLRVCDMCKWKYHDMTHKY